MVKVTASHRIWSGKNWALEDVYSALSRLPQFGIQELGMIDLEIHLRFVLTRRSAAEGT